MSKLFKFFCIVLTGVLMIPSIVFADPGTPYDVSVPVPINVLIGEIATMAVISRNISDDVQASVQFVDPGITTWTTSGQYLDVTYACNLALWGVRIISDNKTAYPGIYGLPIAEGPNAVYDGSPEDPASLDSDDACSYGGLIDAATKTNPDNRAILAWQVFNSKTYPGAPYAINDNSLKGLNASALPTDAYNWNSPWAAVVDVSNTTGGYPQSSYLVNIAVDPDGDTDTISYMYTAQGGARGVGLNYHPVIYTESGNPTIPDEKSDTDGKIAVFLSARFGGLSAGSYGIQLYVQLVRE